MNDSIERTRIGLDSKQANYDEKKTKLPILMDDSVLLQDFDDTHKQLDPYLGLDYDGKPSKLNDY